MMAWAQVVTVEKEYMAPKIRTGNVSEANNSVVINNLILLNFLFCLGGGEGRAWCM